MDTKMCTKCKKEYPPDHFSKKGSGRGTRCSDCVAEYFREYYHKNPERRARHRERVKTNKAKFKNRDLAKKYNTTEKHIEELFAANDGFCLICNKNKAIHLDHCHITGQVRGALCQQCNHGLGNFKDNIEFLESAIEYLRTVYPHSDKV